MKAKNGAQFIDTEEIESIMHFFKNNKLKIVKLNHCLYEEGNTEFDALMSLSSDGETIQIVNKIPLQNAHLISADSH